MKPIKVGKTKLEITGHLYLHTQCSLRRAERGETEMLMSVVDTATGEKGHVLYYVAFDKRDVDDETFHTDNPKLFEQNHPETYELASYPSASEIKKKGSKEIACDHELIYQEGPAGWGLYLRKDDE